MVYQLTKPPGEFPTNPPKLVSQSLVIVRKLSHVYPPRKQSLQTEKRKKAEGETSTFARRATTWLSGIQEIGRTFLKAGEGLGFGNVRSNR